MKPIREYSNLPDPAYTSIMTLEGSTRLRMAREPETLRPAAVAQNAVAPQASTRIGEEALMGSILLGAFSVLFWVLIAYIRSH